MGNASVSYHVCGANISRPRRCHFKKGTEGVISRNASRFISSIRMANAFQDGFAVISCPYELRMLWLLQYAFSSTAFGGAPSRREPIESATFYRIKSRHSRVWNPAKDSRGTAGERLRPLLRQQGEYGMENFSFDFFALPS